MPAWTTTSGAMLQRLGSASPELAVGHVLDDEEPVAARELDERPAAAGRECDAGRILVVRDRVDELRPRSSTQPALELVDVEALLVQRDGLERRLEAPERLDRPEICGALDHDEVARVEIRLGDELERLDRAARDHQLFVRGSSALQRLQPAAEHVERPREPLRRRVLERGRLARGHELLEQGRHTIAGERQRVGEAACEGDDVRHAEEGEHGRDAVTGGARGARRGLDLQPSELRRRRQVGHATSRARSRSRARSTRSRCGVRVRRRPRRRSRRPRSRRTPQAARCRRGG